MIAIFGFAIAAFVLLLSPLSVDVLKGIDGAVNSALIFSPLLWWPEVVSSRGSKIGLEAA
jgi:hypothetical protein